MDSTKIVPLTMSNNEEGSLMIVTLLLTGRATPYIHNGVINVGDENSYVSTNTFFYTFFKNFEYIQALHKSY